MSNGKTRREFLISTGAATALAFLPAKAAFAQNFCRVRRDVTSDFAWHDLELLCQGVEKMKRLSYANSSDPLGWISQAYIHGNCDGFIHCQHSNWYFAPWHRSYLYYFELLIQHFTNNPSFALPYWDWSQTHSVPYAFYGGANNPLADNFSIDCASPGRRVGPEEEFTLDHLSDYVGDARVELIQANPDYVSYGGDAFGGGELEKTPHNFVHIWVGGKMAWSFSPLDPIFWMHHCNVDRLYSDWLARGYNPPNESEWNDKSFNDFYDADGKPVGSEFTCGMTVDSRNMGYVYEDIFSFCVPNLSPRSLTLGQTLSSKPQVIKSVGLSNSSITENVLTFGANVAVPIRARQLLNTTAAGAPNYVVRLRIQGVKLPKQQDTGVFVFFGPGITTETPISAPGFVGNFTFFQGGSGNNSEAKASEDKKNVVLNATEAVKRLYRNTDLPESNTLPVSIVTRSLFGNSDAFATVEEIQPDRVQIDIVDLNP